MRSRSVGWPRFSGGLMLFIASLIVFFSGPAQTYGVSTFVEPLLHELGWSRSLFSAAYSGGTLFSAGLVLVAGRMIDRRGNRLVMSVGAFMFGVALLVMSAVGPVVPLLLGFALLRGFGQGVGPLGARTLIPHWFVRRRGRAFSLLGFATSISLAVFPVANPLAIDAFGWRAAYRLNALLILLIVFPLTALFVRDRPEEVGQLPDGALPDPDAPPIVHAAEPGIPLRMASRTAAFWALMAASAVPSLILTGLSFNQVTILTERGLPATLAATTFTVESIVGLPVTLLAGWLVDRYPLRWALAAGQLLMLGAMVLLLFAHSPWLAFVYAALRGASNGLWMVAADVAWPVYFGRRYLGSIRSVGFAVGVVGAALGTLPFGVAYDRFGGYDPAIVSLLVLPVAAAAAVMIARPPRLAEQAVV